MNEKRLHIALDPDAIFGKSKAYIGKALARKSNKDLDEYQLWASLALELLGKGSLAKIHPSLIVDPQNSESLLAASRINISADIKTITATTLFERLRRIIPSFDEAVKKFCVSIALRRNAELHSGDTPFRSMRLDAWEKQYWHASQIILHHMDSSLDDWLGVSQAQSPKVIIKLAAEAKYHAVTVRVERAGEEFKALPKRDREERLMTAQRIRPNNYKNYFTFLDDHVWKSRCPACEGKALITGVRIDEDIVDVYSDEDRTWEQVETYYSAEQFSCPSCNLFLDGADEIEYAQLDINYSEIQEREIEYEPDYGND
ncbi:MAG: hypothetical protein HQM03_08440 [Magnetococcales bacterium]|nr:hypothetical protein [Magnetococcales bacterium]